MVYLLVGVLGMISNMLVIVTIIYFRELRRRMPNMFILNQSLLDCTAGFFLVATTLFNDISVIESAIGREMFCRLWLTTLPTWGIFLSSTYNLVAVTVERYMAIVYPLSHSQRFTRRRAYVVMVCVWCVGPIYNAAYMVPSSAIVHGRCSVFTVWPNEATQSAVGIITVVVQYFIPLVFISFCYGRIASVLTREDDIAAGATVRSERAAKARRNIIKILAMVSVCFVACWSANQIYFAMYNLGFPVDFNGYFYHFTVICVFVNCCVNPFVYALKYDQFQTALQKLFC
ncbi:Somatostatin receptor type 5, partial [Lamellibrachia satsuma]